MGGASFVIARGRQVNSTSAVVAKEKPTLFKEGELILVTPDTVSAIVEVKTRVENEARLVKAVKKLADEVEGIRQAGNSNCWADLFVFDDSSLESDSVLRAPLRIVRRPRQACELRSACSRGLRSVLGISF